MREAKERDREREGEEVGKKEEEKGKTWMVDHGEEGRAGWASY